MKILVITGNYPRKNALNNGIFIHQQVKALQQLGVECYVLLQHNWFPPFGLHKLHSYWQQGYEMKRVFFEEYEGVKICSVPVFVKIPGRLFKENHYDRAAKSLVSYIRGNSKLKNADWLYAHFLTDNGYIGAKIKDLLQMKLAAIARGDDVHAWPENDPALVTHLRYVFAQADLLLANSGNLAHDTLGWMEADKKRTVSVVYNGVDYNKFCPAKDQEERKKLAEKYNLPAGKKYMVCVATPVALKGWMELLEAIKQCGKQFDGWMLLMVAPPRANKDAIDLQKAGDTLGITDRILYMGEVKPDKLAELLKAVDAFVLPSYNEGMSNALLEAMASGLPCIATAVGGHSEVIERNDEGILVKPRATEELARAIMTITGNEDLRKIMGIKARQKMIAFGDYLSNSRKLLELFNDNDNGSLKK